ncbi:MAG: GxxExxY protein [Deltaproteobacteria bacterium]|nr:GxxExxY protein [Deltaproteobacteria bacterium]
MEFDKLSNRVIGCAIEVHRILGPGLLEESYKQCLAHELRLQGIQFGVEVPLPVEYKGVKLECGYRLDLLVEDSLIVELKAVESLLPLHQAQLITYLKLSRIHTGLLINFNVQKLKAGLKRLVV